MKMRQTLLVFLLALMGGFIGGHLSRGVPVGQEAFAERATDGKRVIEAGEFRLVDQKGLRLASLTIREESGQAALAFYDDKGQERFLLGINYDRQPGMALFDRNGLTNLSVGIPADGQPNLAMYNERGRQTLGVVQEGVYLIAEDGTTRTFLGRGTLRLNDANATLRTALGSLEPPGDKGPGGSRRAVSSLVLFDENGNLLWSAP